MDEKLKQNNHQDDPKQNTPDSSTSSAGQITDAGNIDEGVESTAGQADGATSGSANTANTQASDDSQSVTQGEGAPVGSVEKPPMSETDEMGHSESSMVPIVVGVVILALGIIAAMWFFVGDDQPTIGDSVTQGEVPAFEDEGDPNEVIAMVNGEELTRSEFNRIRQQVLQQFQQQGMDLNDPETIAQVDAQATDTLVNTELIRQAAIAAGATASEEAIENRFAQIVEQVGGQEVLEENLTQLGITEESLRADVEQEIIIDSYLEANVDTDDIDVTDQEIDDFYDQAGGAEAGLPPLEEVRMQIEQQLLAQRQNELISELIETLREGADIELMF